MTRSPSPAALLALFAVIIAAWPLAAQQPGGDVSIQIIPPPPPPPSPLPGEPQSAPLPAAAAPSGPYVISGAVVSAATGVPLDRASVTLSAADETGAQFAEVLTGEAGTFRFDHLAAGKYRLRAYRRGYLASGYQQHDNFVTAIVTGPDLDTQNLRYTLPPEAIIDGLITSDSGDPVGAAQVSLYRQTNASGSSRIVRAGVEITDDTGSFEFSRLRPATYYISVSATPWYAFRPQPKMDASGNPLPPDQQPSPSLDVAYPLTFYPNATDSASAAAIPLHAGDHFDANLSLHAVPAVHLRVQIPAPIPGHSFAMPMLHTQAFGTDQFEHSPSFQVNQTSADRQRGTMTVDIGGVAPGRYDLGEFGPQGEMRGGSVDLTTDQTIDFSASAPSIVDVSGKLAMASGQRLPSSITAVLVPTPSSSASTGDITAHVSADGAFDFHSVPPGGYDLEVRSAGRALAVDQMAASGADVSGSHITVASSPVLLAATLVSGSAIITGYAKENGRGVGGVMILLVPRTLNPGTLDPRDPNAGRELIRRDQSNSDGSFTLQRVVPGDYILVAIDNGWTLDWAEPAVTAPYLAHGLPIRLAPGQKNLTLPTPLPIQSR